MIRHMIIVFYYYFYSCYCMTRKRKTTAKEAKTMKKIVEFLEEYYMECAHK